MDKLGPNPTGISQPITSVGRTLVKGVTPSGGRCWNLTNAFYYSE